MGFLTLHSGLCNSRNPAIEEPPLATESDFSMTLYGSETEHYRGEDPKTICQQSIKQPVIR
jgi:hypothetical protein